MSNNPSAGAEYSKNNAQNSLIRFADIFYAIDDLCQQYLFYPPISHQNAISRIRNAALIISLSAIRNLNHIHYSQTQNNRQNMKNLRLPTKLSHLLLLSILTILDTPISPFAKLKATFILLKNANLNPRFLLKLDIIYDNPTVSQQDSLL